MPHRPHTAVDVSPRNVQSPTEPIEEWAATADGGFARGSEGRKGRERARQVAAGAGDEASAAGGGDEEALSFWGF